jgi:hypothetical protein
VPLGVVLAAARADRGLWALMSGGPKALNGRLRPHRPQASPPADIPARTLTGSAARPAAGNVAGFTEAKHPHDRALSEHAAEPFSCWDFRNKGGRDVKR